LSDSQHALVGGGPVVQSLPENLANQTWGNLPRDEVKHLAVVDIQLRQLMVQVDSRVVDDRNYARRFRQRESVVRLGYNENRHTLFNLIEKKIN
jgi:hypothetical protein